MLLTALVMCGCSAAIHSATVTTTTVPATTTTTIVPADAAQLTAIVLQSSDLPAGWTETSPGDSVTGNNAYGIIDSDMASCVGVPDTGEVAEADSATFGLGINTISASASSYATPADITSVVAVFSNPNFESCVQSDFVSGSVGTDSTIRDLTTTVKIGAGAYPPNVVATVTSTCTVVTHGIGVKFTMNLVIMTGPLVVGGVFFFGARAPISAVIEAGVVAKVALRMAAA